MNIQKQKYILVYKSDFGTQNSIPVLDGGLF